MDTLSHVGSSRASLHRLCEELGLCRLMFLPEVDSTQDVLRHAAAAGAPAWTAVATDHQLNGRGQDRRRWTSVAGAALQFSLLLRPESDTAMSLLPIRIGLAAAEAIDQVVAADARWASPVRIQLKWPNDLMIGDKKAGGILVEGITRGEERWAVAGVGINVLAADTIEVDPGRPAPAFLTTNDGDGEIRLRLFSAILQRLRGYLYLDAPTLVPAELERYAERDWLQGRRLLEPVAGLPRGLQPDGRLIVDLGTTATAIAGGRIVVAPSEGR